MVLESAMWAVFVQPRLIYHLFSESLTFKTIIYHIVPMKYLFGTIYGRYYIKSECF